MTRGERIAILNQIAFHRRTAVNYRRKADKLESQRNSWEYDSRLERYIDKADSAEMLAVSKLDTLIRDRER